MRRDVRDSRALGDKRHRTVGAELCGLGDPAEADLRRRDIGLGAQLLAWGKGWTENPP